MKKLLLTLAILASAFTGTMAQVAIIPQPNEVLLKKGTSTISTSTLMAYPESLKNSANFFNTYLNKYYHFQLDAIAENAAPTTNIIQLTLTNTKKQDNGSYHLLVNDNKIIIESNSEEGIFYGIQSLIQLLPTENNTDGAMNIQNVMIKDAPRFSYRGMHLDVSRHFFGIDYVKKYIDFLALHKMNYFHWHLTDDQGWRIEIKKYPKLTSIGSKREGTIIGRYPGTGFNNTPYEGFYTQEQIKDVVKYAAERYITVVPEIEMPGHSMSVLAAYPEFSTTPNVPKKVSTTWGIFDKENNVLEPSEKTFSFLEDVLTEVMALFPSKYIHIGGDECSKIWWEQSTFSKNLMQEKGLKNAHELQSYFIQRMEKFINKNGRQIIGWDEILEGGLAPNALVMSWRGEKGGIEAAKQKHQVIMTPGSHCYFDHKQIKKEDSVTIGGYTSTEKVYSYEPIPKELNASQAKYVLGAQANVWTEYITNTSKLEYMIFPRMSALSEVLWTSPAQKNYESFKNKLLFQNKRYDLWKVNYFKGNIDIEP